MLRLDPLSYFPSFQIVLVIKCYLPFGKSQEICINHFFFDWQQYIVVGKHRLWHQVLRLQNQLVLDSSPLTTHVIFCQFLNLSESVVH